MSDRQHPSQPFPFEDGKPARPGSDPVSDAMFNDKPVPAGAAPRRMKKKPGRAKTAIWLGGAVILGMILGTAAAGNAEPVEVVKEVPGPVQTETVTEEVEVEVEVAPAACIEALDLPADAVKIMADVAGLASDSVMAAYTRDAATLDALNLQVEGKNSDIKALQAPMAAAASECRAKAE